MRLRLNCFVELGTILFLTACATRTPANLPMIPGVRVDAAVERYQLGPDRGFVRAKAKLVNRGADTARFTVSGCPLTVRASSPDNRDRPPIWSSARLQSPCPDVRRVFRLAPGDSAVLEDDYPMDVISNSGLELKRYAFAVSIRFLEPATESPEYPAGSLTISRWMEFGGALGDQGAVDGCRAESLLFVARLRRQDWADRAPARLATTEESREVCAVWGSPDLVEIKCNVICRNCGAIVRSCADLAAR